jgi:glutaredoxin
MFKVFYMANCKYSSNALNLLDQKKIKYTAIERNDINDDQLPDCIPKDYITYPKIVFEYNNQKLFIGGYNELNTLLSLLNNKLPNKIPSQKYINKHQLCEILLAILN